MNTDVETKRLTVESDGFSGLMHTPKGDAPHGKALIVLGGSEGNENIPMNVGRMFARRGIAALGVMYFNTPGLPRDLVKVPVESVERAVSYLREKGYGKVFVYGISKGAELALLSASLIPQISGVIALSPSHCIWSGMTTGKSLLDKKVTQESEFTWRGKELPFMKERITYAKGIWNLLTGLQVDLSYIYEEALSSFREETAIRVEDIRGDILFLYPEDDRMWPSARSVSYMEERLREKGFPHGVTSVSYEKASHILVPLSPKALRMFRIERKYPEECRQSREDAFERSVGWLLSR